MRLSLMSEKATLKEWYMSCCFVGWVGQFCQSIIVLLFERKFCHQAKSFANFPLPLLERGRSNQL